MTEIRLMEAEWEAAQRLLPALVKTLADRNLMEMEGRDSDVLTVFKEADGPALVAPSHLGGLGASALESTRLLRVIGSLSPSLGAASTMHHLSMATLIEHSAHGAPEERELVAALVDSRALIASGFSEGRAGSSAASAFRPTVTARAVDGGFVVNGRKQPCSLARSMDLLTAGVVDVDSGRRGVIVIFSATPGIRIEPFWNVDVLAAAESDTVVLEDVFVPGELIFWNDVEDPTGQHEKTGYVWFGLLICATYIGAASALLQRVLNSDNADAQTYLRASGELETTMAALEAIAVAFDGGDRSDALSARLLFVRAALSSALRRSVEAAAESLGGINFIRCPEIAYVIAAVQAAAFHPPSKRSAAQALWTYHRGGALDLA